MIWWVWFAASLTAFGIIEALAIGDKVSGNTLSAGWWRMRTHLVTRMVFFPPLTWVIWHLFSPWDRATGGWDDVAVVGVGALLALVTRYDERRGA